MNIKRSMNNRNKKKQSSLTTALVIALILALVLIAILLPIALRSLGGRNKPINADETSAPEIESETQGEDSFEEGSQAEESSAPTESGKPADSKTDSKADSKTDSKTERESSAPAESKEESRSSGNESRGSQESRSDIPPMSKTGKSYWLTHIDDLFAEASKPLDSSVKSTNEIYAITKLLFTCKRAQIETLEKNFNWGIFAKNGMKTEGMDDWEEYILRVITNMGKTTKIEWANVDLDFDKVSLSGDTCTVTVYENFKIIYLTENFGEGVSYVGTRYKITYTYNGKQWFITKLQRNV